jgi:hypothetical protein
MRVPSSPPSCAAAAPHSRGTPLTVSGQRLYLTCNYGDCSLPPPAAAAPPLCVRWSKVVPIEGAVVVCNHRMKRVPSKQTVARTRPNILPFRCPTSGMSKFLALQSLRTPAAGRMCPPPARPKRLRPR